MILGNKSNENFSSGPDERRIITVRLVCDYHGANNVYNALISQFVEPEPLIESQAVQTPVQPDTHEFPLYPVTANTSMDAMRDEARILVAEITGETL